MRNYWLKIILGALGVFAAGMIVVNIGRALRAKAKVVAESDSPITIPLPFVPFRMAGERVGTFDHIVIRRKSPHKVSGIDLTVKLDDASTAARLAGCQIRAELNPANPVKGRAYTLHDARFSCLREPSAAVEEVGTVRLLPGNENLPLVVDTAVAAEMRKQGAGDEASAAADSIAEAADRMADSISEAASRAADSVVSSHQRAADSLRQLLRRRADSVRQRARSMRDSIRHSAKTI
jgi:hypothetical protein